MKHFFHILSALAVLLALCLFSCGKHKSVTDIDMAQEAVINGDYATARRICTEITERFKTDNVTAEYPSALCRLALIYVALADNENGMTNEEDMAMAAHYFQKALEISEDSVANFVAMSMTEDAATTALLFQLGRSSLLVLPDTGTVLMESDRLPDDDMESPLE